ncbi:MAG: conserved repeat domain protein [Verrucomicrobiales bacterium]|nr:conserved repeat domain protein [Verrucomicrobiales bacterium]
MAPANGIAKFTTLGSGFDTLLAVYSSTNNNPVSFDELTPFAGSDDSDGLQLESEVEFGALAGHRYEIAIDGYFGAVGGLELGLNFDSTSFVPPVILSVPPNQAVQLGVPVTLSINVTNIGSAKLKWMFNGVENGVIDTNFTIASMSAANVGRYSVKVAMNGGNSYTSMPFELQVNTEGITTALAQGKILDAPSTPLIGSADAGGNFVIRPRTPTGVVRGYTGSQIFNSTYAVIDPTEPAHCGVSGGSSYWLIYQPPANGTITLDTVGSAYDTVVQAYAYNGAINSYADLIPISCDNNSAGNGAGRISFPAVKTRQYVVAVEGVAGANGLGYLNYSLNTNQIPQAPSLLAPVASTVVQPGTPVSLTPSISGCPPLIFVWKKNNATIATTSSVNFPSVTTTDAGSYSFVVTNDLGTLSAAMPLRVVIPPALSWTVGAGLTLNIPTLTNQLYSIEEATNITGPWQAWSNNFVGDGQTLQLDISGSGMHFYRIAVQ